MALKFDYVIRETTRNLRRNFLMSSAAILTVAVSLSLVGGALLLKQGVSNATVQWRGGVELSVWMKNDASQAQIDAVKTELQSIPEIKRFTYVDKPAAYEEAKTLFSSQPDVLDALTVETMPPSFRVVPMRVELSDSIGDRFQNRPGVKDVTYARDQVKNLLTFTRVLQFSLVTIAIALLVSAALLILNTIRMAIFARRREISVMKLVGATNWFIRVPFMLEGMIQGLIGAAVAFTAVIGTRLMLVELADDNQSGLLHQLVATPAQAVGTGIFVIVVGVVVGVIGSLVAVHKFLDA